VTTPGSGGRAGHEHDRDFVDKDNTGAEPVQREGEFTAKDVGPDDTDPPKGSYTDLDTPR
jgi:hypothetical protein